MKSLLLALGLTSVGLCQSQLKNQPADPRSSLVLPPKLGMGTWYLDDSQKQNTTEAVAQAIVHGFRHIDGAPIYGNEAGVGAGIKEGIKRAGIKRSDVWVTTKLWDDMHQDPEKAISDTLKAMGLDYIDLYLLHFPIGERTTGAQTKYVFDHVETWKLMEKLIRQNGPTRYIGVANLGPQLLNDLLGNATYKPLAHQFEAHPYLQQRDWVKHNQDQNLTVIAYAPLGNTSPTYRTNFLYANDAVVGNIPMLLEEPAIVKLAQKTGCTPVQVVLQFNLRRGVVPIPKSGNETHQQENLKALNCKLSDEDDQTIAGIEKQYGSRRVLNVCALFGMNHCYDGLGGLDAWKAWTSPLGLVTQYRRAVWHEPLLRWTWWFGCLEGVD